MIKSSVFAHLSAWTRYLSTMLSACVFAHLSARTRYLSTLCPCIFIKIDRRTHAMIKSNEGDHSPVVIHILRDLFCLIVKL